MGLGGLFISTNNPPQVGTTIQSPFDVAKAEVLARAVARSVLARRGMGMEIIALPPGDRARWSRWLERLATDSKPYDQEDSGRKRRFEPVAPPKGMWVAWYGKRQMGRISPEFPVGYTVTDPSYLQSGIVSKQ